jgi:hypothetical protein
VGCAARSRTRCGYGPFPRSLPPNPAGTFQCTGLSSDCAAFATGPGPFLPRSRRTSSTVPASCITHTSRFLIVRSPVPLRPVVRLSRSPELAGRYSCDYYGHSVAIGLASRRRSHVQQRYTSERDLGVPFASFNALTGHRSCVPEDCGVLL